ncbi:MAG: formyltransferase family protein [Planctomycetota bacterium]
MKISILISDPRHPVNGPMRAWRDRRAAEHRVELVQHSRELSGGDVLFLISAHEVIRADVRARYRKTLVVHASDLPRGRGWSPHVWAVLEGAQSITVSLLEAEDSVDTGAIWRKTSFALEGHELHDELNTKLFDAEVALMDFAVDHFDEVRPEPQAAEGASVYRRRTPEDSRLDLDRPLREQLPLLRVSDPARYPAFFEHAGHLFELTLRKRPPD